MFACNAYLNLSDKSVQDYHVSVRQEEHDGVYAVFVKGFSQMELDADFGVGIDFAPNGAESWMADFRHSEYWCMPAFGTAFQDVPEETQGLIYRKSDGTFGVVLPVVSEKYKCVLCGAEHGGLTAKLFSWYEHLNSCDALAFVYAEGENPYRLLEVCAKTALRLLNTGVRIRAERRYPEIFEYLGWCSWDAMEIRVCEADLLKKAQEFQEKNIPVKWAIIDDMWAEVHDFYGAEYADRPEMFRLMHASKLYSFAADPVRFPNGLKGCIEKLNACGLQVGMWHPTTGYWLGLDPEGEAYRECEPYLIRTQDGRYVPSYEQEKAYGFYHAFHERLRKCGAAFVKIDNQSMTRRFYKSLAPVGKVARSFHGAMEASVGQHFDNTMINCMGMASEDMWNRSVSPISRCSDDFLPEDSAWFTKHILQCSYNDLIQGQFYYCDWDMWWTDDGQAVKNSVLRAVSGGPVYISDKLGRSRLEILAPLALEDGRILRCDRPAMPAADCLTVNPTASGQPFKLQNVCGNNGVLAVFNLDEDNRAVAGSISPCDIDGITGETFAVYEHFSRELFILGAQERLDLQLRDIDDYKLYIVVPIQDGFAAIGRTDKFISPKTIKAVYGRRVELVETGEYAVVENGRLMIR